MYRFFLRPSFLVPLFVMIGSATLVFSSFPKPATTSAVATAAPHQVVRVVSGNVIELTLPSLNLDLAVKKGTYDTASQTWTLNDHDVFINADQPQISTDVNAPLAFLYGHNTDAVLARTARLRKGDILQAITNNGYRFTYSFTAAYLVEPTNTSVITDTSYGQLVLLSCDGILNQHRRIAYFNFEKVEAL